MKRMIKASTYAQDLESLITKYLNKVVYELASMAYDKAPLDTEDFRNDYFPENIREDSDVRKAAEALKAAVIEAANRQMRR